MIYHCWPTAWIKAAIESGLAVKTGFGCQFIGGQDMQDKLTKFAGLIYEAAESDMAHEAVSGETMKIAHLMTGD